MFSNLIEYFIPPEYHETEESSRKSRLAIGAYLIVAIFSFIYSILNILAETWGGFASQFPLFVITVFCLFLYRWRLSPFRVAFIFFTEAIIAISIAIYYTGGVDSFVLPWLATTPIVALLVSGKWMGYYTLLGQLTMLTMFYIFDNYDIHPGSFDSGELPLFLVMTGYAGLIIILFVIGTIFEQEKSRAMGKLEEKNQQLQSAIHQLESTQEQLVQQEKLASLGQLTAGIAHEMKNPLNFISNFSDLSIELVDEALEEVKRETSENQKEKTKEKISDGKGEEMKDPPSGGEFLSDILDDVKTNLRKIHNHSTRVNLIIKAMLQHSRTGAGEKSEVNLNGLVKEVVNLAYHSFQARDNSFEVELDMELENGLGEITLVTEDISRVILNLCNNAFDAMREKSDVRRDSKRSGEPRSVTADDSPFEEPVSKPREGAEVPDGTAGDDSPDEYVPKLTVRTKSSGNTVTIDIEDNGPGIPEEIKDKILQPFFTTKKGTEGTGLGLSITNDIIKAHGGTLTMGTEQNQFTRFTIQLNNK